MKSTQTISFLVLGVLTLSPIISCAQTDANTGVATGASATARGTTATTETSVSGGVTPQGVVSPRDAASGLPTGKRQYQPVIIRKELDKASPQLMQARDSATGQASGKRLNGLPPGIPVTGTRMMNASGTAMSHEGIDMHGKIMGSTTRPLPAGLEKRMENLDDMRAKMMRNGSSTEGRGNEMRGKMMERRSEILKRVAHQMVGRMNAAIERLSKLADRIDSRIAKLKAKSIDTSKTEASIAIARTKIADAKAAVAVAVSAIETASVQADASASSTTPVDAGKPVREALEKARIAVVTAHKALVDAIVTLKANAKIDDEVHASMTSPATN